MIVNKISDKKAFNQFIFYLSCKNFDKALLAFEKIDKNNINSLIIKLIELKLGSHFEDFIETNKLALYEDKSIYIRLVQRNNHIASKNLAMLRYGQIISDVFKKKGIEHVFLKGFALITAYYEDIRHREIKDIDILVHKSDAKEAYRLIGDLGFYSKNNKTPNNNFKIDESKYCLPDLINEDGIVIELHFSLGNEKDLTSSMLSKEIFNYKCYTNIGETSLPIPGPNQLLLSNIYHGITKELFRPGTITLTDTFEIFKKNKIDLMLIYKQSLKLNLNKEFSIITNLIYKYASDENKKLFAPIYPEKTNTYIESISEKLMIDRRFPNELLRYELSRTRKLKIKRILKYLNISKYDLSHKYSININRNTLIFKWFYIIKIYEMLSLFIYGMLTKIFNIKARKELKSLRALKDFID